MKIATWNVNSIRKRLPLVLSWLDKHKPDVFCLQETKVKDESFPADALRESGYHVRFRGKSSFSGVATLTRSQPERVIHGFRPDRDEEDDRVLLTVVNGVPVVNTYVPQGQKVSSDKYQYKLQWFERAVEFFDCYLEAKKPAVWLGDLNVAPEPMDVYHADRRMMDPDSHIDARNAFKRAAAWGWVDTFRKMHPDRVQYTYWDYFRNALQNNWGWRIDHIMVTAPLASKCRVVEVDMEPRREKETSDHTVIWAEFDGVGD